MANSKKLKQHLYAECDGFYSWADADERLERTTPYLALVTCGQCKGYILNNLRKTDWSTLDDETLAVLQRFV